MPVVGMHEHPGARPSQSVEGPRPKFIDVIKGITFVQPMKPNTVLRTIRSESGRFSGLFHSKGKSHDNRTPGSQPKTTIGAGEPAQMTEHAVLSKDNQSQD